MLSILTDRTYRHLFLAQIVALLGTGLGPWPQNGEHAATAARGYAFSIVDKSGDLRFGRCRIQKTASV
jgi:hypothetical protein